MRLKKQLENIIKEKTPNRYEVLSQILEFLSINGIQPDSLLKGLLKSQHGAIEFSFGNLNLALIHKYDYSLSFDDTDDYELEIFDTPLEIWITRIERKDRIKLVFKYEPKDLLYLLPNTDTNSKPAKTTSSNNRSINTKAKPLVTCEDKKMAIKLLVNLRENGAQSVESLSKNSKSAIDETAQILRVLEGLGLVEASGVKRGKARRYRLNRKAVSFFKTSRQ